MPAPEPLAPYKSIFQPGSMRPPSSTWRRLQSCPPPALEARFKFLYPLKELLLNLALRGGDG